MTAIFKPTIEREMQNLEIEMICLILTILNDTVFEAGWTGRLDMNACRRLVTETYGLSLTPVDIEATKDQDSHVYLVRSEARVRLLERTVT